MGGIAGYSKAMTQYRVNKTIEQINMISTNIRTLFGPQGNYVGLNDGVLVKAKAIPDEMIVNGELVNVLGGDIVIASGLKLSAGEKDTAFTITYKNIPPEACIALLTQNWGDSGSLIAYGDYSYVVDQSYIDYCDSRTKIGSDPRNPSNPISIGVQCAKDGLMSVENATTYCAVNSNPKELTWKFY